MNSPTFEQLVDSIRLELKVFAANKSSELSGLTPEQKIEFNHRASELRASSRIYTERVAAEIIHYATSD